VNLSPAVFVAAKSKNMNRFSAIIATASFLVMVNVTSITVKDFKPAFGNWKGTITYKDYTSGKAFTMPANLIVAPGATNRFQLILFYEYPNEPKANGNDTMSFSVDGQQLNNETLVSKTKKGKGTLEIITERAGVDGNDNKKALIRHIYSINKKRFIIRKEVKFDGTGEYIMRNEYSMSR
jgi:hypothetical protein